MPTLTDRHTRRDTATVAGILCAVGHFNHPRWRHCRSCGSSLPTCGAAPARGPRPVVGMLVRDDGLRVAVSGPLLVVLRDAASAPTCVPATDEGHALLRVHLDFDGWDPVLTCAAPGVALVPAAGAALPLPPGIPTALPDGWAVRLGRSRTLPRDFLYSSLIPELVPDVGAALLPVATRGRHRARRSRLPDPSIFLRRSAT